MRTDDMVLECWKSNRFSIGLQVELVLTQQEHQLITSTGSVWVEKLC